jgi:hypothetical protein
MLVTRFGVSVENVVATMETPISHHGAARPDVKNSAVFRPARRASSTAGRNDTASETATMVQSSEVRCIPIVSSTGCGASGRGPYCGRGPNANRTPTAPRATKAERAAPMTWPALCTVLCPTSHESHTYGTGW